MKCKAFVVNETRTLLHAVKRLAAKCCHAVTLARRPAVRVCHINRLSAMNLAVGIFRVAIPVTVPVENVRPLVVPA